MKIVLISDSHGLKHLDGYKEFEKADILIHAGDSQLLSEELDNFDYKVRGNCDYFSDLEKTIVFELVEKKFLLTHGDLYSPNELLKLAKENQCNIVIHGHTHVVRHEYIDGILFLNPGSLRQSRCHYSESYMVLDEQKIYLKDAKTLKTIEEYEWI